MSRASSASIALRSPVGLRPVAGNPYTQERVSHLVPRYAPTYVTMSALNSMVGSYAKLLLLLSCSARAGRRWAGSRAEPSCELRAVAD